MFWLQLQFFSRCCVAIQYCNVTPFLYRILCFRNAICIITLSEVVVQGKKQHKVSILSLVLARREKDI